MPFNKRPQVQEALRRYPYKCCAPQLTLKAIGSSPPPPSSDPKAASDLIVQRSGVGYLPKIDALRNNNQSSYGLD